MMETPANPWKVACFFLFLLLLIPVLIAYWFLKFSFKMALRIIGIRLGRPGRSLMDELFFHRFLEIVFRRREQMPCYQLVINTAGGTQIARQEGEFRSAQPIVGHQVQLWGKVRDGVLVIKRGYDETLGAQFMRPPHLYIPLFFLMLTILAFIILAGAS